MLGSAGRRVKAALVLALLAACSWRSTARTAAVHVDVLVAIAHKGADLVAEGRFAAENLPELTYPLERAQRFAEAVRARAGAQPPEFLPAFDVLLDRYRTFVDALDQVRRAERGAAARTALAGPLAAVDEAAQAVRAALAAR